MAYYRRYRTSKRRYSKRRTYGRKRQGGSWGATAIKALGGFGLRLLKNKLGLNTEKHWLDTAETSVACSSTWSVMANPLVIPIGDSVNTRTGNGVRGTSLILRGRVQSNTAATTGSLVRVLLVYYPAMHGNTFTASDIVDTNTRITTPFNMGDTAGAGNYKILYDKTMTLEVSGQGKDTAYFNYTWRPMNWHIKFTAADTAGTLANIIQGQVRGIIITSDGSANPPAYWADWRVKFVDN